MANGNGEVLSIRTEEGIAFSLPLAGPAARFLAIAIDVALLSAAQSVIYSLSQFLSLINRDIASAIIAIVVFVINIGYGIAFEWFLQGQTVGKRLLGLRVVDVQGLRLTFSQVAVRNLLRVVDMIPMFYFVGGVMMLLSPRNQRLGDLAGNTVVVRERPVSQPALDKVMPGKYNSFRDYPHLEARLRQQIPPARAAVLMQALLRREELEPEARVALYATLAEDLRTCAAFPEEACLGLSDEQYLRNVLESLMRRRTVSD